MKPITKEWLSKADADWRVAKREFKVDYRPSYDVVCFHCQQCAEKHLKAYLQEHSIAFPYTHNLRKLLDLCITLDGLFVVLQTDTAMLADYAVDVRYPGDAADKTEAHDAIEAMNRIRKFIRKKLGLR
jgi:HEPN domain-containing protein